MTDPYFPANQTAIAFLTQRMEKLEAEIATLKEIAVRETMNVATLRAALKPFADAFDNCRFEYSAALFKSSDLRAAAAALKETGDE